MNEVTRNRLLGLVFVSIFTMGTTTDFKSGFFMFVAYIFGLAVADQNPLTK